MQLYAPKYAYAVLTSKMISNSAGNFSLEVNACIALQKVVTHVYVPTPSCEKIKCDIIQNSSENTTSSMPTQYSTFSTITKNPQMQHQFWWIIHYITNITFEIIDLRHLRYVLYATDAPKKAGRQRKDEKPASKVKYLTKTLKPSVSMIEISKIRTLSILRPHFLCLSNTSRIFPSYTQTRFVYIACR